MKYHVFNETDGILADPEAMTDIEAHRFIQAFRERFQQQGYYASVRGRIPIDQVQFSLIPAGAKMHTPMPPQRHIPRLGNRCRCLECAQKREARNAQPPAPKKPTGRPPRPKWQEPQDYTPQEDGPHREFGPLEMLVICRRRGVIFLRLPLQLQQGIGMCDCAYCKAHPDHKPMFDALAISTNAAVYMRNRSWTVHMPDPKLFADMIKERL